MCSEVMYGAYYPYLYGRAAGPSRPFYQYDRVSFVPLIVLQFVKIVGKSDFLVIITVTISQ